MNRVNMSIPKVAFPSISEFKIDLLDEPLISLSSLGLKVDPMYYNQGIESALNDVYLRLTPAYMLLKANDLLPFGYSIKAYDGYRPISVQQHLWDMYRKQVSEDLKNADLSDEEIDFKTSFFVSKPSYDAKQPSLHNTGGAIDITIVGPDDKELDMGTAFDDFSNKAWTNHFEEYEYNEIVRNNRRMLYHTMIRAGFTNLPSEWWHYDFGTKFWAYFKQRDALYTGFLDTDIKQLCVKT